MPVLSLSLAALMVLSPDLGWQPEEDRPIMALCPHNPGLEASRRFYNDGFRWIRADLGWHHIQPERDVWQWEGMDGTIHANRLAGEGVPVRDFI